VGGRPSLGAVVYRTDSAACNWGNLDSQQADKKQKAHRRITKLDTWKAQFPHIVILTGVKWKLSTLSHINGKKRNA
jgi:hypothetical protein